MAYVIKHRDNFTFTLEICILKLVMILLLLHGTCVPTFAAILQTTPALVSCFLS
jgi:hypothetical protein